MGGTRARGGRKACIVIVVVAASLAASLTQLAARSRHAEGASLRAGFREEIVFAGLNQPTAVRFSPDGRVFVAEKSGVIKVFSDLADATPTVFADLRTQVHNYWDRGLLGLALDPEFPAQPWVYVLYTRDAVVGGPAPRWGSPGGTSDDCPTPPGSTADGCVVSGRLSRLEAAGDVMTGTEQVLIDGWCQQYPSHSTGSLAFDDDGALYASGGDGASFNFVDYGQAGSPTNPCGDPPGGAGTILVPPTAEGGASAQPGPPHHWRRRRPERRDPPRRSGLWAGSARQPFRQQSRCQCPTHRRVRVAEPVPNRRATRHPRGLGRRCRLG